MNVVGGTPSFGRLVFRIVRNVVLMTSSGVACVWAFNAFLGPPIGAIGFVARLCALMLAFFLVFEALDATVMKGNSPWGTFFAILVTPFVLFGGLGVAAFLHLGTASFPWIVGAMLISYAFATVARTIR